MAGLLPADAVAELQHLLQHVPVSHRGADQPDVVLVAELVEPQVAHHRAHDGTPRQQALVPHIQPAHGHGLVAVDDLPPLVDHQAPVRVAVEGDAQVVLPRRDHSGQALQMGGAAAVVDVHTVGLAVDEVRLHLELGEQVRGRGGGGAVGAVDEDPQAAQIVLNGVGQVLDILILQVLHAVDPLADAGAGLDGHGLIGEDLLLHPGL